MRRGISILLVLFFGLGPLSATLQASDDSRLPACCRRHGAHHCAMSDAMMAGMLQAASGKPILTAPAHCPLYPSGGCAAVAPVYALAPSGESLQTLLACEHTAVATRVAERTSRLRSHAVRGPPTIIFG
jgi:hypothetical protein